MSWFHRKLNPGPLAPLPNALPLDQQAKGKSLKKLVIIKFHFYVRPNVLEFCIGKFFSANFPLPVGLEVARSARVREVQGSNPGETRTWKNSTVEELKTIFFITLRVPTLRFGGSFFLYLTFYSNPFWHGVIHFGQLRATLLSLKLWSAQYISDWLGLMAFAGASLKLGNNFWV